MCTVSGFYILTVSVHQDELLPKTLLSIHQHTAKIKASTVESSGQKRTTLLPGY